MTHFLHAQRKLLSSAVSSVRQVIETFFSWLDERFDLQHASKVRSSAGFYVFVLSRLSAAIFCCVILDWGLLIYLRSKSRIWKFILR